MSKRNREIATEQARRQRQRAAKRSGRRRGRAAEHSRTSKHQHAAAWSRTAVIICREYPPEGLAELRKAGEAYAAGIGLWEASDARFVLLLAQERHGEQARAPLVGLARDLDALRAVVQMVCGMLDTVQCAWLLPPDADARAAVSEILLADAVPVGAA
jgi:hypothetical protein